MAVEPVDQRLLDDWFDPEFVLVHVGEVLDFFVVLFVKQVFNSLTFGLLEQFLLVPVLSVVINLSQGQQALFPVFVDTINLRLDITDPVCVDSASYERNEVLLIHPEVLLCDVFGSKDAELHCLNVVHLVLRIGWAHKICWRLLPRLLARHHSLLGLV